MVDHWIIFLKYHTISLYIAPPQVRGRKTVKCELEALFFHVYCIKKYEKFRLNEGGWKISYFFFLKIKKGGKKEGNEQWLIFVFGWKMCEIVLIYYWCRVKIYTFGLNYTWAENFLDFCFNSSRFPDEIILKVLTRLKYSINRSNLSKEFCFVFDVLYVEYYSTKKKFLKPNTSTNWKIFLNLLHYCRTM